MKIAHWASRHTRAILFLLALLILAGAYGSSVLPVGLFPHVNFPLIRINVDAGERPAERMIVEVTNPVEEALRGVPGIRAINSTTSRGSAQVSLYFQWGQDMLAATLQAESAINRILPDLPAGTTFQVYRMDPTVFPVIAYSVTSDTRDVTELRSISQQQIRPLLSAIPGVAKIGVDGGAAAEFRVTVDPARLRAHNLSVSDVTSALTAANVLTAVGHVEENFRLYLAVADTQFKNAADIGSTVLHSGAGGVTLLRDVASIDREAAPQFIHATADGHDAVLINVYQQPGGNTVEIAAGIRAALADAAKKLPQDIKLTNWYDQSDLITASAVSVRDAVIVGVLLAAVVLLAFLRNLRMTLIAVLAVPAVLAITALLLYALNMSFNIMTLGGMAAAVGLIIDDAIVISEHIVRRLHAPGHQAVDAAGQVLNATEEFTKPLAGSSLSTIVIHIPPAFLVGVFGAFFAALSLSMAASLAISFFVAWLAIPVIAAHWLRAKDVRLEEAGIVARSAYGSYGWIMRGILPVPWVILIVVVALLWFGYRSEKNGRFGVMPKVDEGGFVIDYQGPPGASITEMDRLLGQVEQILHDTPEVASYSRRTGLALGGDLMETNSGDFFVRLKPLPRRSAQEIMDDLHHQVLSTIAGFVNFEPKQQMEDLLNDLSGQPQPVVINLYSDDQATLMDFAPKVQDILQTIRGVTDTDGGITPAGDDIEIQIDRVKAALEGVDSDKLTQEIEELLSGHVATQLTQGAQVLDVRVWIPPQARRSSSDLSEMLLKAPDGHFFPLKRVAEFHIVPGRPEITRDNLKQVISVAINNEDIDLGATAGAAKEKLDAPGFLPQGVRYTIGGQYAQAQLVMQGVTRVIIAGAALVFLLLLLMYESFRVAIAIMLTTLLALAAVFIGLRWTGTELNISSLMGMVMIVGNVTEVAIFYYNEYADFFIEGDADQRFIEAGTFRMRAIAMTTVAAILALLPLALNLGQGAAMLQPLAIAIIAGLIVQLPLVLIVLPALLKIMHVGRRRAVPGIA